MERDTAKLEMKLLESEFHFSRRMLTFFAAMELTTIEDLVKIPLDELNSFRGFKSKCREELICFVETQYLEELFKGFKAWKRSC